MISRRVVVAAPLIWMLGDAASARAAEDPDAPLPTTHWLYDALNTLAGAGWDTAVPYGMGHPVFSKREFAEFFLNALASGQRGAEVGAPLGGGLRRRLVNTLRMIRAELRVELIAMGVPEGELTDVIEQLGAFAADGKPRGVAIPLSGHLLRTDYSARQEGRLAARSELARGEFVLWVPARPVETRGLRLDHALRLQYFPDGRVDERVAQRVAGHNAEVWMRLRDWRGDPLTPAWLPDIFDLAGTWRRDRRRVVRLTEKHPEAVLRGEEGSKGVRLLRRLSRHRLSPPGAYREPDGRVRPPRVGDREGDQVIFEDAAAREVTLALPIQPLLDQPIEIIWGPEGSALVYVRLRVQHSEDAPFRVYAVELRTGGILNAAASA